MQKILVGFDPVGNTLVLADCTLGAFTLLLPDVRSLSPLCSFTIVKTDSGANSVTVASVLGQKISGGASVSIDTQFNSVTFNFDQSTGYYVTLGSASSGGSGTITLPSTRLAIGNATGDGITSDARLTFDAALAKLVVGGAVTASTYMATPLIKFDGSVPVAPAEGDIWYDTTENTLCVQSDIANTTLNVGQEELVRCVNKTGSLIADGKVVYISGAQGNRPTITLASYTDEDSANKTIGVVTADIADNGEGYVCISGVVNGYNTSTFTAGDRLYLSTAGGLTKTRPSYGIVAVAYALNATNNGKILVILHRGVTVDGVLPYTGFNNPDNVVSAYDPATQKITLSGTAILYYRGVVVFDLNAGNHVSSARTAGNGIWFYYYNGTSYVWSTTPWAFDMAMLGIVYKSATAEFGICEVHGDMPANTHRRLHEEIGTSRIGTTGVASGVVVASTVAANRRPAFTTSTIRDEDITTIIDAQTAGSYTQMHVGATNTTVFTAGSADIVELAGSTPRVNNPADGSFTTLGNNEYMNVFAIDVPTMSDTGSKVFRRWFLNGQLKSTSRTTIDNQAISSLNLGDINPLYLEFVFAYRYLIRANASSTDWTVISENRLTGNKVAQVSSVSAYAVALASLVTGGAGLIPFGDATGHTVDAAFKYVSSVLYAPSVSLSLGVGVGAGVPTGNYPVIASIGSASGVLFSVKNTTNGTGSTAGFTATNASGHYFQMSMTSAVFSGLNGVMLMQSTGPGGVLFESVGLYEVSFSQYNSGRFKRLIIGTDGNLKCTTSLRIGDSTSPSYPLDVVGNSRISGLAGTGSRIVSVDANGLMSATYVNPWRGSNLSAAPSSPVEGQMYSDTSRIVYVYENTAWTPLNAAPLFA